MLSPKCWGLAHQPKHEPLCYLDIADACSFPKLECWWILQLPIDFSLISHPCEAVGNFDKDVEHRICVLNLETPL